MSRIDQGPTLDQVHAVGKEISRVVQPVVTVDIRDVHDERVPLPVADGISTPELDVASDVRAGRCRDDPELVDFLEDPEDVVRADWLDEVMNR